MFIQFPVIYSPKYFHDVEIAYDEVTNGGVVI
jgi:hypothetical protein